MFVQLVVTFECIAVSRLNKKSVNLNIQFADTCMFYLSFNCLFSFCWFLSINYYHCCLFAAGIRLFGTRCHSSVVNVSSLAVSRNRLRTELWFVQYLRHCHWKSQHLIRKLWLCYAPLYFILTKSRDCQCSNNNNNNNNNKTSVNKRFLLTSL